jgi:hypothetical protein
MASRAGDAVQSYAKLTSSLLERWSAHASRVASNVEAPDYDAASAAADLIACASLATESGFLLAVQALEAVATLGGLQDGQNIVESPPFTAPNGAALKLAGPLVESPGLDELPVSVVSIQPPQLAPTESEFTLRANAAGHRGATYVGTVEASTGAANVAAAAPVQVTVWITVP